MQPSPIGPIPHAPGHHSSVSNAPAVEIVKEVGKKELQKLLSHLSQNELTTWANSKNQRGQTPLAIAIEAHTSPVNKMDVITYLVEKCGADVNLGDNDNWTPLYRASTGTRSDVIHFLLAKEANPNLANKDGSTPLHRSVDRGNVEDVKALIGKANVNHINCFGTPLAYAAKNGNIQIAEVLLEANANPHLVGEPLDFTPIELATINGKEEIVKLLLQTKVEDSTSPEASSHLNKLAREGDEAAIIASIMNNTLDQYGRTAAHYCASLGKTEIFSKIPQEVNVDIPDHKGRPPLHYAVMRGHFETVENLIDRGCEITSRDKQGYSPLMWASQCHQVGIATHILSKAEKDQKLPTLLAITDNFGWTSLHKAAQVGNLPLVRLFVEEYHVDPLIQTSNGRTPYDLAETTKASEVMEYLRTRTSSHPKTFPKV